MKGARWFAPFRFTAPQPDGVPDLWPRGTYLRLTVGQPLANFFEMNFRLAFRNNPPHRAYNFRIADHPRSDCHERKGGE
jgi:hypothetical protein